MIVGGFWVNGMIIGLYQEGIAPQANRHRYLSGITTVSERHHSGINTVVGGVGFGGWGNWIIFRFFGVDVVNSSGIFKLSFK